MAKVQKPYRGFSGAAIIRSIVVAQYKGTYHAYIAALPTEARLTAELVDHGELSICDGDWHIVDLEISDRANSRLADLIAERDRLQAKAA